jgi:cyclopropane-fatty-acyl-phospholipid synthase
MSTQDLETSASAAHTDAGARTDTNSHAAAPGSAAGQLAALYRALTGGELPVGVRAWDGSQAGPSSGPTAVLNSPSALRRLLWHPGELGLAQAYVTGELDVDGDVAEGLRRVWDAARASGRSSAKPGVMASVRALGTARRLGALGLCPAPPATQAQLRGRLHTRVRDRDAIAHHYDLSNEFYALLLDESMAYSCAYWTGDEPEYTLADAQRDKLNLICRKLRLTAGTRLLDVGCGWGSLTVHAARHYGARVVAVTLAQEQAAHVRRRVADLGLGDRVEVRLQHYREIDPAARFDAAATVEMGEHVGGREYPGFARRLHDLLVPGGRLLVQQMSRSGPRPGGGPFIERFIAPDMHMRPVGETVALLERAGLEVRGMEAMREHYVRTVRVWLDTLEARWDQVQAMVGPETARVWRLYLAGGALAFEEGRMGVDQILAVRPSAHGRSTADAAA